MKQTMQLVKVKETKGTVRYDDPGSGEVLVPAVYLKKALLTQPYPERITLTVEAP